MRKPKKRLIAAILIFLLLFLSGCGDTSDQEEAVNDAYVKNHVIPAYAEYIQKYYDESEHFFAQRLRFCLIYIDEDDIPELILIEDDSHASGVKIFVYKEAEVMQVGEEEFGSRGSFLYLPYENIFLSGFSNMGEDISSIYSIDGNNAIERQFFHSYPQYDEDYMHVKDIFEIDGREVSEEEYDEAYIKWKTLEMEMVSYEDAVLFIDVDNVSEEMERLLLRP